MTIAAALAASLGACGGGPGAGTWGPLAVIPGDGTGISIAAALSGRLSLDAECVFVASPGGLKYTVVWQEGVTRWDPERKVITFTTTDRTDVDLKIGDDVTFSGGYDAKPERWVSKPTASCPPELFVVDRLMTTNP